MLDEIWLEFNSNALLITLHLDYTIWWWVKILLDFIVIILKWYLRWFVIYSILQFLKCKFILLLIFFLLSFRSSKVLASPLQSPDMQMYGTIDQVPKEVECQGCPFLSYLELNQAKPAVEPKTGIEFPLVLDNIFAGEKDFGFNSEVKYFVCKVLFWFFWAFCFFVCRVFLCAPCNCFRLLVKSFLLDFCMIDV